MFCASYEYTLESSAPSYIFHNQHKTLNNLYKSSTLKHFEAIFIREITS